MEVRTWHPYVLGKAGRDQGLIDHHYYLVTHRDYNTPIKAKWHDGMDEHWEVFGCARYDDVGKTVLGMDEIEFWYPWDYDNPIVAWMEMPYVYHAL